MYLFLVGYDWDDLWSVSGKRNVDCLLMGVGILLLSDVEILVKEEFLL